MAFCEKCLREFNSVLSRCPYCRAIVESKVKNFSFSEILEDNQNLNLYEEKKKIREEFMVRRRAMKKRLVKSFTKSIHKYLFASEYYKYAKTVLTYLSMSDEIDTKKIISKALKDKKTVAVPRVRKRLEMDFIRINGLENLEVSKFGIQEPYFDENKIIKPDGDTLIILPGLAFDKDKYRIGYGGGFYDYFLDTANYYKTVALCYEWQIAEQIPSEKFDIRVNVIITEKGERI